MRITVGISGASGAQYALRLLSRLQGLGHETHAVITDNGWKILRHECSVGENELTALVARIHAIGDLGAPIASGSFPVDGMVVVPCSMATIAAVSVGMADNLLRRAADVCIKEKRPLILAAREMPFSAIHLENMLKLSRLGASIMPLCPGFYHHPENIADLVDFAVERILNALGVEDQTKKQWQGFP